MSEPTDTRARAIAEQVWDEIAATGDEKNPVTVIIAALRAQRKAVWEEAAKEVEVHALHAEATSNQQALQMADDICATLRQRAAAEGQEPT